MSHFPQMQRPLGLGAGWCNALRSVSAEPEASLAIT